MSELSGNSCSTFNLSPWAARRMGHDTDEKASWCPIVGFRLVFEVAFEAYRGSMHNRTPDVACGPDRCLVSPLRSHRNLGFRLIREEGT